MRDNQRLCLNLLRGLRKDAIITVIDDIIGQYTKLVTCKWMDW